MGTSGVKWPLLQVGTQLLAYLNTALDMAMDLVNVLKSTLVDTEEKMFHGCHMDIEKEHANCHIHRVHSPVASCGEHRLLSMVEGGHLEQLISVTAEG